MCFWLLKTEPSCWSWADQERAHRTSWDGVRNPQAQKFMRTMQKENLAFFYHTGSERAIQGIVRILNTAYPDHTDANQKAIMVDVETSQKFKKPVTLNDIKQTAELSHLIILKQSRLSVAPVDAASWSLLCTMGGIQIP